MEELGGRWSWSRGAGEKAKGGRRRAGHVGACGTPRVGFIRGDTRLTSRFWVVILFFFFFFFGPGSDPSWSCHLDPLIHCARPGREPAPWPIPLCHSRNARGRSILNKVISPTAVFPSPTVLPSSELRKLRARADLVQGCGVHPDFRRGQG